MRLWLRHKKISIGDLVRHRLTGSVGTVVGKTTEANGYTTYCRIEWVQHKALGLYIRADYLEEISPLDAMAALKDSGP